MVSLKAVRAAGVPLVAIETNDPAQTVLTIALEQNGKAATTPLLQWDFSRALTSLNDAGNDEISGICRDLEPRAQTNLAEVLPLLGTVKGGVDPEDSQKRIGSITFIHNAQLSWTRPDVLQGIWNLRDVYKPIGATLVLLCSSASTLPAELKNDVIVLKESIPTSQEIIDVADRTIADSGIDPKLVGDRTRIYDTLIGSPSAFSVEQVVALSITKSGVDREGLWSRQLQTIEATKGLKVYRGKETFKEVGGYENGKQYLKRLVLGKERFGCIVFIDEIEKQLAGSSTSGGDSSGTSQYALGITLQKMEDLRAVGVLLIGPPGSGKSLVAKACGNEAGIPTISLDYGGTKDKLVGSSEENIRQAWEVIEAISGGKILVIATCNSIGVLPPELRRRFTLGTFFFPLPTKAEREIIWPIWEAKYKVGSQKRPADDGWTGAEIRNCCEVAYRLDITLIEAAAYIVPVSVMASDQIDKLCRESHRRYISASVSGLYQYDKLVSEPVATGRKIGGLQ